MRPKPPRRALLALLSGALVVASCAPTVRVHGYVPSQADVARITPGRDTAATVEEAWGRPSSSGIISDSAWYYVQSTVESFTYNPPRVVDRTVLAVNFTSGGVVEDVVRYGLEDGRIIALTARTTDTGGRQLGVLEQLFGNLLNLDAEAFEQ